MNTEISPIYFVHKHLNTEWPDLMGNKSPGTSSKYIHRYKNGRDDWIIKTYLELLHRGNKVALSQHFVSGQICVAHHDHIINAHDAAKSYVVAIKADRSPTYTCEHEIVQSPSSIKSTNDFYIPFWPQSNIIPRDRNRQSRIENIAFMGEERNLAARFRDSIFYDKLNEIGVRFRLVGRSGWHNFRNVDLVIAIRDGTDYFLASKPANKLINAWIAGVPAIVGREPAYASLCRSELDCFIADSQDDVITIVQKLKENPNLYLDMVKNGLERSDEFTYDNICKEWEHAFHKIRHDHAIWRTKQHRLMGLYPYAIYWFRVLLRYLFTREYNRGYDESGNRLTLLYRLKKKCRRMIRK